VPFVRGNLLCRPATEIMEEFISLLESLNDIEIPQIIYFLGQSVLDYKCPDNGLDFKELISTALLALMLSPMTAKTEHKLNFMSAHPKDFDKDFIKMISKCYQIERNIHLPLQSGSNKILKSMNRGYTLEEYSKKIQLLRKLVPDVRITTDIICGFPGETEEDYQDTVRAMKELKFNSAFIFPYSKRTGTKADKMEEQVEHKIKKQRVTELLRIQKEIR